MKEERKKFLFLILIDGLGDVSYSGQGWWQKHLSTCYQQQQEKQITKQDSTNITNSHSQNQIVSPESFSRYLSSSNSPNFFTPLQLAATPTCDRICRLGTLCLMDPCYPPGLACGSDTAHLSLFGYDPRVYYRGRGAFETIGAGLPMKPGDIAFKSNFAVLDEDSGIVTSRRADRDFKATGPALCAFLEGKINQLLSADDSPFPHITIALKYATEHRCAVRLRHELDSSKLSDFITGTDPLKDNLPLLTCKPTEGSNVEGDAEYTCKLVNFISKLFSRFMKQFYLEELGSTTVVSNIILLRGAGALLQVPKFDAFSSGSTFAVAPTCIIRGLLKSIGFGDQVLEVVPGATGDYETNLIAKADYMLNKFRSTLERKGENSQGTDDSLFFIHVKAVDDAGHDRNGLYKLHFIEQVDIMMDYLIRGIHSALNNGSILQGDELLNALANVSIAVTSDHSTTLHLGDHSNEPVPLAFCNLAQYNEDRKESEAKGEVEDKVSFDEISAEKQGLVIKGLDLIPFIQSKM